MSNCPYDISNVPPSFPHQAEYEQMRVPLRTAGSLAFQQSNINFANYKPKTNLNKKFMVYFN